MIPDVITKNDFYRFLYEEGTPEGVGLTSDIFKVVKIENSHWIKVRRIHIDRIESQFSREASIEEEKIEDDYQLTLKKLKEEFTEGVFDYTDEPECLEKEEFLKGEKDQKLEEFRNNHLKTFTEKLEDRLEYDEYWINFSKIHRFEYSCLDDILKLCKFEFLESL